MCRSRRSGERPLRRKRRRRGGALLRAPVHPAGGSSAALPCAVASGGGARFLSLALRSFYAIAVLRSRRLIRQL